MKLSQRTWYAIQNLGVDLRQPLDEKDKRHVAKYIEDGTVLLLRNCGFMTTNQLRRWVGMPEINRKEYRELYKQAWRDNARIFATIRTLNPTIYAGT